jgi:hypothetical protein
VTIQSWPDTAAFGILNGEPAMTLIPNLLATGILAIAAALAVGIWSVQYAGRRHGGLVLIGLSVLLLLVGGGFGPPLVGIILGIAATRLDASHQPQGRAMNAWGRLWPWFMASGVAGFLALLPGTILLGEVFGIENEALVYTFSAFAFGGLVLALLTAHAHDRLAHLAA